MRISLDEHEVHVALAEWISGVKGTRFEKAHVNINLGDEDNMVSFEGVDFTICGDTADIIITQFIHRNISENLSIVNMEWDNMSDHMVHIDYFHTNLSR